MLVPLLHGGTVSCWVCRGATAFTDEYDLDWCDEHIDIWKKAVRDSASDPSLS